MSNYFDEDFFKLLLGFVAIISLSLIIMLATRVYSSKLNVQTSSVVLSSS